MTASLLLLEGVVDESSFDLWWVDEVGGVLIASKSWSSSEENEVDGILVNSEDSSLVDTEWSQEEQGTDRVEVLWLVDVSGNAGVCSVFEKEWLYVHLFYIII